MAKELFNQCRILFNKVWSGHEKNGENSNEIHKLSSDKNLILNQQKSGSPEDGSGNKLNIHNSYSLIFTYYLFRRT
jgi:hypothetical protein